MSTRSLRSYTRMSCLFHLLTTSNIYLSVLHHQTDVNVVLVESLAIQPSPVSVTRQLFPYQEEGVERLVSAERLLLADEMGLGKTVQCIEGMNRILNTKKKAKNSIVLVVCPKSVLSVWENELESWLKVPSNTMKIRVVTAAAKSFPTPTKGSITLINYDICYKYRKELQKVGEYDILICDEAHYLKSRTTQRTLAVIGDGSEDEMGIWSKYIWFLTGTPVLNRPAELYPLLRAISPDEYDSFEEYANRYCDPKTVFIRVGKCTVDYTGASNLNELSKRLEPIMLRRYKNDVLPQLPPKFRSCLYLPNSKVSSELEKELLSEVMFHNNDNYNNIETFGSEASDLTTYLDKNFDSFNERMLGDIAEIRQQTALAKLQPTIDILEDAIISEKLVVFAHHRKLVLELAKHFGNDKAVYVLGGMDSESRRDAVKSFQEDPNIRLFVGSIRAAGLGLTLTSSSRVIFLELDWSPGIMSQAEDRCHRVGQEHDCVQVQYFVFKDTIDEWFAKSLLCKSNNIEKILPKTTKASSSSSSATTTQQSHYTFDFGKHKGLRLEDIPKNYIDNFIIKKEVYRNRKSLWHALYTKGLVTEEPPPSPSSSSSSSSNKTISNNNNNIKSEEEEKKKEEKAVNFVFDFGKHKGIKWNDVPINYREWIIKEGVWKNRTNLKIALSDAGLLEEEEEEESQPEEASSTTEETLTPSPKNKKLPLPFDKISFDDVPF